MPQHTEEFQLKRLFRDHTEVINQFHTKSGLFCYDREQRKYIVNGGERTKKRLQFLLENDRELKKALKEDAEKMNEYNQSNYLDDDLNRIRRERAPIKKLPRPLKYMALEELSDYIGDEVFQDYKSNGGPWKRILYKKEMEPSYWREHVAHLVPWDKVTHPFQKFTAEEFNSVKGPGVENVTDCCKDIVRIIHGLHGIDPENHVDPEFQEKDLNGRKRARGEKFLRADSSSSESSSSSSSSSNSSSGSSRSFSFSVSTCSSSEWSESDSDSCICPAAPQKWDIPYCSIIFTDSTSCFTASSGSYFTASPAFWFTASPTFCFTASPAFCFTAYSSSK